MIYRLAESVERRCPGYGRLLYIRRSERQAREEAAKKVKTELDAAVKVNTELDPEASGGSDMPAEILGCMTAKASSAPFPSP